RSAGCCRRGSGRGGAWASRRIASGWLEGRGMTRRSALREHCGFFAIGVEGGKCEANIGSLWRSADLFGAAFIFTVGARYRKQASDTMRSARHIPLFGFGSVDDLYAHLPVDASLVAVELTDDARDLVSFVHPEQACYVLGAEDVGL